MTQPQASPPSPEQSQEPPPVSVPIPGSLRRATWVAYAMALVQVLVLAATTMVLPWYLNRPESIPRDPATRVADLRGAPFVSPSPVVRPAAHRSAPQRLVGEVFAETDATREMRLRGVPFTFLTPPSWGCLGGGGAPGGAVSWRCVDEQGGQSRPQIDLMVLHCQGACTDAGRTTVDGELAGPPTYLVVDPATRLAEQTHDAVYVLTISRVFAVAAGGPTAWLLVAQAKATSADRATVQKIVNDMYRQTL